MVNNVIHSKPKAFGIDRVILQIQSHISNRLKWDGTNNIYGKIQSIVRDSERGDVQTPSVYDNNREYLSDVYVEDTCTSTIAFLVRERVSDNSWIRNVVDVIVSVDLEKAFQNKLREDERALSEMFDILTKNEFIVDRKGIKEGHKSVWQGFDQSQIKSRDMQPFYCFSITCQIDFYDNYLNCSKYVD